MTEQATVTGLGQPGRPANSQPVPWHGARLLAAGPWRSGRAWMTRGACTAPEVDPDWFTVEEDAPGAAEQITRAKAVCRGCPVRLLCRIHADETGEYGVYNAETYSERTRRLRRWHRLELPA
jgi:WhiB family redox-sensing transcriptional regulator